MKIKLDIFGESHFHKEEVDDIRNKIIKQEPNIILLESYSDDYNFYHQHLPKAIIKRLEPQYKNKDESLLKQFFTREEKMIKSIKDSIIQHDIESNLSICVQVGDTHLRTIETKELGKNILRTYIDSISKSNTNVIVKVHRSKHKEIK